MSIFCNLLFLYCFCQEFVYVDDLKEFSTNCDYFSKLEQSVLPDPEVCLPDPRLVNLQNPIVVIENILRNGSYDS